MQTKKAAENIVEVMILVERRDRRRTQQDGIEGNDAICYGSPETSYSRRVSHRNVSRAFILTYLPRWRPTKALSVPVLWSQRDLFVDWEPAQSRGPCYSIYVVLRPFQSRPLRNVNGILPQVSNNLGPILCV